MQLVRKLLPIYLAGFFYYLHYAFILFVNSSLLTSTFGERGTSILYISSSFLGIFLLFLVPRVVAIRSPKAILITFLVLEYTAITGLITATSPVFIALSFLLHGGSSLLIFYLTDLFLEDLTDDRITGEIRGSYLTLGNLAVALSPLAVAFLVSENNLVSIYIASLTLLLPIFFLVTLGFKSNIPVPHFKHLSLPMSKWWSLVNVRRVSIARFVLEFFYSFMIIYTPIYLTQEIGFTWQEIGVMFSIMLLPFVLFQWPVGWLADKKYGEKEFMTSGFFIMGVTLLALPFLGKGAILWTAMLFLTRVGASWVEVTTDSYFFKHIDKEDTRMISIFRLSRPLAVITGASAGALTLALLPFSSVFFVLSFVVFFGMKEASLLHDTR